MRRAALAAQPERLDEGDLLGALPWLMEALRLDEGSADRERVHRARIGFLLRHSPKLVQMWFRGIYDESLEVPDRTKLEKLTRQMAGAGRRLVPDRRRDKLLAKRSATTARITALWAPPQAATHGH